MTVVSEDPFSLTHILNPLPLLGDKGRAEIPDVILCLLLLRLSAHSLRAGVVPYLFSGEGSSVSAPVLLH